MSENREQTHEFCAAWTREIADVFGGLTVYERQRIYMLLHSFRKAVPNLDHPDEKPISQTSLFEATP